MIGAPRKARSRVAGVLALAALTVAGAVAMPAAAAAKPSKVKVMTRNLYLGADLTPAIAAPNAPAAYTAAGDIYDSVLDTNFVARSRLLAAEIAQSKPHLIGLQEVALWRRGQIGAPDGPAPGGAPAEEVVVDFLEDLTDRLRRLGLSYRVAVVQQEADIEIPTDRSGDGVPEFDGRLTMHDVILARQGMRLRNRQGANFEAFVSIPTAGLGTVSVARGYTAVDAKRGRFGKRFRFINTHLEAFNAFIRNAQAGQLTGAGSVSDTDLPVVLVGDLNSDPDDPSVDPNGVPTANAAAYNTVVAAGYADRGVEVPTCCHEADLRNPPPAPFDERIDHVMSKGRVAERSSFLIGANALMRTPTGLWPSDHGGVVSGLTVR